ncbi:MAG TPA: GNAT family N-acetyltransferase [Terriglobales bacterium]|nr:GNAT family N-acetyltransferase [Terriglobales bacterium]
MQLQSHAAGRGAHNMEVVSLAPQHYAEWDRFCEASDEAWFWHSTRWLEYSLHYRPDLHPRSQSFFCRQDGQWLAIVPLIVEDRCDIGGRAAAEFSFGADCGPVPAFANEVSSQTRKALEQAVFGHLESLAEQLKVKRASFRASPLAPSFWSSPTPRPNPLLKMGFADISWATQVLDLDADEAQLLRGMRKGHRADITRGEKLMQARILDRHNITSEAFESYRLLHHRAAGRVTRPLVTFEMMHGWIRDGLAILCAASLDGRDVGFALVSIFKEGAYYSSSCEDPEHNHLPIGHLMQWKVLQWLKQHGIRRYEIGIQFYGAQPHTAVSEKEVKIAFFKRGFGGSAVPLWRGEKFYDKQYCLAAWKERAEKYAATVGGPAPQIPE